jgi:hypothetical protein
MTSLNHQGPALRKMEPTCSLRVMLVRVSSLTQPLCLAWCSSEAHCCKPAMPPTKVTCTDWQLPSTPSRAAEHVANSDIRLLAGRSLLMRPYTSGGSWAGAGAAMDSGDATKEML